MAVFEVWFWKMAQRKSEQVEKPIQRLAEYLKQIEKYSKKLSRCGIFEASMGNLAVRITGFGSLNLKI